MRRILCLTIALVAALGAAGCGSDEGDSADTSGGLVVSGPETDHVHALGVDPKDGAIVVAAHSGLFRAEPGAQAATRLGDDRRDVMGFTVEGPGRYVGSGHPDLRAIQDGAPTSVGFIRSTDAGRNWETVSLEGTADLHVLEVVAGRVYAFDAITGKFLASKDGGGTWRRSVVPPMIDLAVDPDDPDTIVASTEGGLRRSTDGGLTWRNIDDTPPSQLVWRPEGLLRLGYDGVARTAARLGDAPVELGKLPAAPGAAAAAGDRVLLAGDDGAVFASADGGRTWRRQLQPAE